MYKFVIMGVQGCGKGTQAGMLCRDYDLIHISVGDILRWNIKSHTKLGARIKRIVAAGELVGDDVIEGLVHLRLEEHDWNYGFILDGFPRNHHQAVFFLERYDIDAVIHINVPDQVVLDRILGRRLCVKCGTDFNVIMHWPKEPGICDMCGGDLVQRLDDSEESIRKRLSDFHTKTLPVLDLFRRKELVVEVDGTGAPADIQAAIRRSLGMPEVQAPVKAG